MVGSDAWNHGQPTVFEYFVPFLKRFSRLDSGNPIGCKEVFLAA